MTRTTSSPMAPLLAELVRRGIYIEAQAGQLRYRPRDRMTPDLAEKLRRHKPELLARLGAAGEAPGRYTEAEERLLGGVPAPVRTTVDLIKATFADLGGGLKVVEVHDDPARFRDQAARLIRQARRASDRPRAIVLRDAWAERMAICTIDGGLDLADAERVAVDELLVYAKDRGWG